MLLSEAEREELREMDAYYSYLDSISVVQSDPTPADVKTYLPEYAFSENWNTGRRFKMVSSIEGVINPDLQDVEAECEFIFVYNDRGDFWIFYRAPDGRRARANWSEVLPLTDADPSQPNRLPPEAELANWSNGTLARYIGHCSEEITSLYPEAFTELVEVDNVWGEGSPRVRVTNDDGLDWTHDWFDLEIVR